MARTETGANLTQIHRNRQLQVRAAALREFMQLWPIWTPGDPRSFERLVDATVPLVRNRRRTSAGIASDYYRAFRSVEAGGTIEPRIMAAIERDRIAASLYATGEAQARRSLAAGHSPQAARQNTLVTVSGAVGRHVMDGGRMTLTEAIRADGQAVGWERKTGSDPCAFCAMLAGRGRVYKSQEAAERVGFHDERTPRGIPAQYGRIRGTQDKGDPYHDHCECTAEPAYIDSPMISPENQRFRDMWDESTRGERDALKAFRRVYEGAG